MKIELDRKRSSFFPQSQVRAGKSKIISIGGRKDEWLLKRKLKYEIARNLS